MRIPLLCGAPGAGHRIGRRISLGLGVLVVACAGLAACAGGGDPPAAGADPTEPSVPADPVPAGLIRLVGQLRGLQPGQSLVLGNVAADGRVLDSLTLAANGSYQFAVPQGSAYDIRVLAQPAGQRCSASHAGGIASAAQAATGLVVECVPVTHSLGGAASGLVGAAVLRNGGDGQTVQLAGEGAFRFPNPIAHGQAYSVEVVAAGPGVACRVTAGTGVALDDVSVISVVCLVQPQPAPPVLRIPSVPAGLTVTAGLKTLSFSWTAAAGATSYQLLEDVDGAAGPSLYATVGTDITGTAFVHRVAVHTRLNARYALLACSADGCSAASAAVSPDLRQAIGYFKASNTGVNDQFGWNLALSADGQTLAVTALYEDSNARGVNGNQADNSATNSGAVYVFARVNGTWQQQAYLKASNTDAEDWFGAGLALSADGHTLAVGAPLESGASTLINGNGADNSATYAGAVYVFVRDAANNWSQQAYVKAFNAGAGDQFGLSVALSASGDVLAVGAPRESSKFAGVNPADPSDDSLQNAGAAYVFTRSGTSWAQQAYIKASTPKDWALFGYRVALSADGKVLATTSWLEDGAGFGINADQGFNDVEGNDTGAAFVFVLGPTGWVQQAYIKASNPGVNDRFGQSLALSADGRTLAVGAHFEDSAAVGVNGNQADNSAPDAGAVYVFIRLPTGAWAQQAYLKASNTAANDQFGWSLALSADGDMLAVGAHLEDGAGTGVGADPSSHASADAGAVYLFGRSSGTWVQRAYIKAPNTGAGDRFGAAVGLSADGNTLAVSAQLEDSNATGVNGNQGNNAATNSGAAYLY